MFLFLVPTLAFATTITGPLHDTNESRFFYSNQYDYSQYFTSLSIVGHGKGNVEYLVPSGTEKVPYSLTDPNVAVPVDVPDKSYAFKLNASTGYAWSKVGKSTNPNSTEIRFTPPKVIPPIEDGGSPSTGGGGVTTVKGIPTYQNGDDSYKFTYSGWPSTVAWYQLYFKDHTGEYKSDKYVKKPTGTHILTCNGEYEIRFFDSSNNLVAKTNTVNTSQINNPSCSSYDGDPTAGNGESSGDCGECCEQAVNVLNRLLEASEASNMELSGMSGILDNLLDATKDSGYKLDDINKSLGSVIDRLDGANDRLDGVNERLNKVNDTLLNIEEQVTPKGTYSIPFMDWENELKKHTAPHLNKISRVDDNNTYFTDPGQSSQGVRMPKQPGIFYPVPIGESYQADSLLIPDTPYKQDGVLKPDESMDKQPVGSRDNPFKVDPVKQKDKFTQGSLLDRQPSHGRDKPMKPDLVREKEKPMKPDPVREKDRFTKDPLFERNSFEKTPRKDRTNFYQKQEVPK
ncbi:hypothetical protein [Brevibacillus laterosporus]|uniref:hypothetical protein n=1 Tax=Brevibacillus laterosporus TaxID=1465 RepID=UPI003D1F954C